MQAGAGDAGTLAAAQGDNKDYQKHIAVSVCTVGPRVWVKTLTHACQVQK